MLFIPVTGVSAIKYSAARIQPCSGPRNNGPGGRGCCVLLPFVSAQAHWPKDSPFFYISGTELRATLHQCPLTLSPWFWQHVDSSGRPFRELDNTGYIELVLLLVGEHASFLGGCYKVWGCWDSLNRQGVGRWGIREYIPHTKPLRTWGTKRM